jgi:hypothetical protein
MTNHEVIHGFRIGNRCSWRNLVKFLKRNLNCIRFYLIREKNGNSMVIAHEQWALTSFLSLDSLAQRVEECGGSGAREAKNSIDC